MTNNPEKVKGLGDSGIEVKERIPLVVEPTEHNNDYLDVKEESMGHMLKE